MGPPGIPGLPGRSELPGPGPSNYSSSFSLEQQQTKSQQPNGAGVIF